MNPSAFGLRLNRRETVWKYLVGVKYRQEVKQQDLQVVSKIFPATFSPQNSFELADNTTVFPFDSGNTTIPLTREPLKGFTLKRTISGTGSGSSSTEETPLSNPEIVNLKTDNGKIVSEVYVYV